MKILVTGGAGFIGRNLVNRADNCGHEFVTLDLPGRGGDIQHNLMYPLTLPKFDAVIHLAAKSGVRNDMGPRINVLNKTMAQNVLNWATEMGVNLVINASSSSVYGLEKRQIEMAHSLKPVSEYGKSKLAIEGLMNEWARTQKGLAVNFRLFNVIGHHQRSDMLPYLIADHLKNDKPLHLLGTRQRNFTYVGDVVDAFVACVNLFAPAKRSQHFTMNVGTGATLTQRQLIAKFEAYTGRHARALDTPEHAADVPVTKADTEFFKSVFGWAPSPDHVDHGVREICADFGLFK
jgi:nucleoside-diphosphate-sugar epimerase